MAGIVEAINIHIIIFNISHPPFLHFVVNVYTESHTVAQIFFFFFLGHILPMFGRSSIPCGMWFAIRKLQGSPGLPALWDLLIPLATRQQRVLKGQSRYEVQQ